MKGNVGLIREFLQNNKPPWLVCLYTAPLNGQDPLQYSAGYFGMTAENVEYLGEESIMFSSGEGQMFFVAQAMGQIEKTINGDGIWFPYVNLKVVPEDFFETPFVEIRKIEGGQTNE